MSQPASLRGREPDPDQTLSLRDGILLLAYLQLLIRDLDMRYFLLVDRVVELGVRSQRDAQVELLLQHHAVVGVGPFHLRIKLALGGKDAGAGDPHSGVDQGDLIGLCGDQGKGLGAALAQLRVDLGLLSRSLAFCRLFQRLAEGKSRTAGGIQVDPVLGRILEIAGYSGVETIRDAAGLDRVVSACWMR